MLGQYLPTAGTVRAGRPSSRPAASSPPGCWPPATRPAPSSAAYECGIVPTKETPERFPVKFFLVAMIFIVFDIEIIFFYPYAIAHGGLGIFGLVVIMVFTFAVFESFVYLISNGALEWGPLKQVASSVGRVSRPSAPPSPPSAGSVSRTAARPSSPEKPHEAPWSRRHQRHRRPRPRGDGPQLPHRQHREPGPAGPGLAACGPPPSVWPAAPSR